MFGLSGGSTPEPALQQPVPLHHEEREGRSRSKKSSRRDSPASNGDGEDRREQPCHLPDEADDHGSKSVASLSVEETNKLRAKLGLKPLQVSLLLKE